MTVNQLLNEISSSKRYPFSKIKSFLVCNNTSVFDECSYLNRAKISKKDKTVYLYNDKNSHISYTLEEFSDILKSNSQIGDFTILLYDYEKNEIVKMSDKKSIEISPNYSMDDAVGAVIMHAVSANDEEAGIFCFK